jgi:hypothetical protein
MAWADFFRIPLLCHAGEPSRPVQESYLDLMNSDLYVGFAEGDCPAFWTEWNLAVGLHIPAFGYVDGRTALPLQHPPRHVRGAPNFAAALAADLVHYANRGFSRCDHHASLRTLIAADPALLCIVLAGLADREFRSICRHLTFQGRDARLVMCREMLRDPSAERREDIVRCLEAEIPGIFAAEGDSATQAFFPFQAAAS